MTEEIKVGDIVKLKSGGPEMTVIEIHTENNPKAPIVCRWFTNNEKSEFGQFVPESLCKCLSAAQK